MFLNTNFKNNKPLTKEVLAIVNLFLSSGIDTNWADENGYTVFHYAVLFTNKKIIRTLAEQGRANIEAVSKKGQSPLSLALQCATKNVNELLRLGAKTDTLSDKEKNRLERRFRKHLKKLSSDLKLARSKDAPRWQIGLDQALAAVPNENKTLNSTVISLAVQSRGCWHNRITQTVKTCDLPAQKLAPGS